MNFNEIGNYKVVGGHGSPPPEGTLFKFTPFDLVQEAFCKATNSPTEDGQSEQPDLSVVSF